MASVRTTPASAKAPQLIGVRGHRVRNLARAEERRREILTGAARAFARRGYDATNMDEIASECGLAKGHIYHYFRGKEEIFTEIRVYIMTRIIEELTALAREVGDDTAAVLHKWISHLITRFSREEERYEPVMGGEESLSAENRKRIRTLSRRIEQMFVNLLRHGMETRVFVAGDPKLTTFVILRAANTVTNWYREGGKWKLDWIAEQVTDQLLRSVLRADRVRPSSSRKLARIS